MNQNQRSENSARREVRKLLSDNAITTSSTAETSLRLLAGEEYLDTERLERGVLRATVAASATQDLLPRRTVREDTWSKILGILGKA